MLGDEIAHVYVGEARRKFTVHKKRLCDESEFFRSAFTRFKEAEENQINLPEDKVDAVEALVNFIYRGSVPKVEQDDDHLRGDLRKLYHLYYLAEKLCMTKLMDMTLDSIDRFRIDQEGEKGSVMMQRSSIIKDVYENTHNHSKLRAYCVAITSRALLKSTLDEGWIRDYSQLQQYFPEFFLDLFQYQATNLNRNSLDWRYASLAGLKDFGNCDFHHHEDSKDCYLKLGYIHCRTTKDQLLYTCKGKLRLCYVARLA